MLFSLFFTGFLLFSPRDILHILLAFSGLKHSFALPLTFSILCTPAHSFLNATEREISRNWATFAKLITKETRNWNDAKRRALYASTRWALGHVVTLTFDPKINSSSLFQSASALVKFSPLHRLSRYRVIYVKNCIFQHVTVTLAFDLFVQKLEAFINVPMLKVWWNYVQHFSRYCVKMFGTHGQADSQTDRQTDRQTTSPTT